MVNPQNVKNDQHASFAAISTNLDALRTANLITQAQRNRVSTHQNAIAISGLNPAYAWRRSSRHSARQ